MDYDGEGNRDEMIDDIIIRIPLDVSGRSFSRMTYEGRSGYARIDLSTRVSCAENFYGSDCRTLCVVPDDALGHFTCSSEGELVCQAAVGCCKLTFNRIITMH